VMNDVELAGLSRVILRSLRSFHPPPMAPQCAVQQPSQLRHAFHPGGGTQARMTLKRSFA
jgi:hypothetical protein